MADQSDRNAFLIHLGVYAGVNAGLAAFNLSQTPSAGEARELWFIWPLLGWGIGVAAHGFAVWAQQRAKSGGLISDPDARGVAVHLFVYLAVNALLVAVNLTASPETLWVIWPVLGWGAGLAAHAWLAYQAMTRRTVEQYANEQRILSEMQLEKQAARIADAIAEAQGKMKKAVMPPKRGKQAGAKSTKRPAARKGSGTGAKRKTAAKSSGAAKARKAPVRGKTGKTAAKKASTKKPAARRKTTSSRPTKNA